MFSPSNLPSAAVGASADDGASLVDVRLLVLGGVDEEGRPLWFPEDQIPQVAIDSSAAVAAGLTFRPAEGTAADTLRWAEESGDTDLTDGAFAAREQKIIQSLLEGRS